MATHAIMSSFVFGARRADPSHRWTVLADLSDHVERVATVKLFT
eukprot:COSAG02_NODE_49327_length_327_cov_1.131579_1_plen_43_part_10